MSLSDKQFAGLAQKLSTDGGFSANSKTGAAPTDGFMVSLPGHEQQARTQDVTGGVIKGFSQKHAAPLRGDDRYIGGWDNEGETSLDVSQNIRPRADVSRDYGAGVAAADARTSAEDLASARNQESVYDVKRDDVFFNAHFDATRRDGVA
jgi:hypothetical protein